jgi:hypothetical protein
MHRTELHELAKEAAARGGTSHRHGADGHIRIIHAATGELLRELTLNPSNDYQPTGAPKGPKRKKFRT